jgi:lambda family phage tail tape measure protein
VLSLDPVEVKFLADMSQLKRDVDEMKRIVGDGVKQSADGAAAAAAGGIESALSGVVGKLAGIASLAGLQQTLSAVHGAALEAEKSQLLLSGALKSTGYAAGLTKKEVEGLVQELTNSSNFDDESLRSAAAALLRFRDIQGDTFRETLRLAPDVAAALGTDIVDAARQLGRAVNDPATGMRGLKSAGIALNETQIELAKKLRDSGDAAGAARIALDAVRNSVAGQSAESKQGLLGGTIELKKAWGELLEAFGNTESYRASSNSFLTGLTEKIQLLQQVVEAGSGSVSNYMMELVGIRAPGEQKKREQDETAARAVAEQAERAKAEAGSKRRDDERAEEARAAAARKAAEEGKKLTEQYNDLIKSIREKTAASALEAQQDQQLTEGQKLAARLMADLRDGTLKLTEARKIALTAELETLIASERAAAARKEFLKQNEEERKAENERIQTQFKAIDSLDEQIKKEREHNEEIGLTKEQLDALRLARMDDTVAIRERQLAQEIATNGETAYAEALRIQIEQLRELRNLSASSQVKQVAADAAKKAEEDWKRTSENIERSLTDALMRGFEGGKDAAQNFRQVLWNMFRTLVLQPLLKPIVEPMAQAMSGLGQAMQQAISGAFTGGGSYPYGGAAFDVGNMSANGNAFDSAGVVPFARGGVVSRPTLFPFAKGTGLMGEAGPEAIMPLRRGRDGRLGVELAGATSSGEVNVTVNNYTSAQVETRSSSVDGRQDLVVIIRDTMRGLVGGGELDGVMGASYNARRAGVLRG